jgi:hypothetical protein
MAVPRGRLTDGRSWVLIANRASRAVSCYAELFTPKMRFYGKAFLCYPPTDFFPGFHRLDAYSFPIYAIFLDFEIWSPFGNRSGKSMVTSQIYKLCSKYVWGQPPLYGTLANNHGVI